MEDETNYFILAWHMVFLPWHVSDTEGLCVSYCEDVNDWMSRSDGRWWTHSPQGQFSLCEQQLDSASEGHRIIQMA